VLNMTVVRAQPLTPFWQQAMQKVCLDWNRFTYLDAQEQELPRAQFAHAPSLTYLQCAVC